MRLGQAWRAVRDRFRSAGLPNADLDARLLARAAFGLDALALSLHERHDAEPEGLACLDALALRRLAGEPVARLLGRQEFYGLDFTLNAGTLVPRPETELLVELALARLEGRSAPRVLDLGTGSGAIIIAMLAQRPDALGVAVDLAPQALDAARANAERHGVNGRLSLASGSWFEPVGERRFDVIVSNPPYIESAAIAGLQPEVRDHDPILALDGGSDGLEPYRVIAKAAPRHLVPGGAVLVEIGESQGPAVAALFAEAGLGGIGIAKDLAGLDRVVFGHHLDTSGDTLV